jgi:putative oxidoreductase
MITHGYPKFQKVVNQDFEFAEPLSGIGMNGAVTLVIAVLAEFFAPILIILGLKTKWVSLLTAATMAVAAFIVHFSDPVKVKEKALLYLVIYVVIFLMGPGKYSLDQRNR